MFTRPPAKSSIAIISLVLLGIVLSGCGAPLPAAPASNARQAAAAQRPPWQPRIAVQPAAKDPQRQGL